MKILYYVGLHYSFILSGFFFYFIGVNKLLGNFVGYLIINLTNLICGSQEILRSLHLNFEKPLIIVRLAHIYYRFK